MKTLEEFKALAEEKIGGDIYPPTGKSWDECLTYEDSVGTIFWFNDSDGSTHIVIEEV